MEKMKAIVGKIKSLREEVKHRLGDPSGLSELLVELATYNADLGDLLATSKMKYEKERGIKYKEYLKEKSNAQAENLSRADLADIRGSIQLLELLHKDVTIMISSIQSRLRSLENESKTQY